MFNDRHSLTHSLRQSDIVDYRAAYFAAKNSDKMMGKRSLEGKMEARERDRERKRRDQLTLYQLEHVRSADRNYKKNKRLNMT